jgi:hypothetical protein
MIITLLKSTHLRPATSVDSKALTRTLSPLESALTKTGEGYESARRLTSCMPRPFKCVLQLSPLFSHRCALFSTTSATQLFWNQWVAHSFRRHGGVGGPAAQLTGNFPRRMSPPCLILLQEFVDRAQQRAAAEWLCQQPHGGVGLHRFSRGSLTVTGHV